MKILIALVVVLALARTFEVHGVPLSHTHRDSFSTRGLKEDLNDFLALVPIEKVTDLFYQYLEEDEDFGEALDYVMSDEFKSLLIEIQSMTEVKDLLNYLQESRLDAYGFINKINAILGIDAISPALKVRSTSLRITGGLPGFIIDVKALLPIEQIKKLYYEKLESSEDFATLVTRLKSKEFQALVDKVYANPKLQDLIKRAEAKGVDVQAILDFLSTLLGLKFPPRPTVLLTRNLKDDLNDFLALVPREKIVDLFYQYLEEDEDFGEALDYVMSDEFKSLLVEIESISEVKDLFKFLEASGLDVYGFLNKIHEILGLEPNHQARSRSNRITGGLPGFIIDVKALLPIEQIKKLYYEKLETSDDFATLVTRLKSKEFQALVDKVYANPKLQDLIKRAEAKGVDVQAILDFLSTLLGLKFPPRPTVLLTRNLKDDLNDFLALVPREKIVDLFYQYLEEDEDFGEALDYVMSDEFKSLLVEIESISEVKDLFEFLEASGLDVYGFLNKIHEILGLEPIHQLRSRSNRITGGLPGFIIDVKALLPIEQIKKLYYEKLETSDDFATLVTRLKSKEFQALVDKVYANPKLQDLIKRTEAKGVDVQAILDFLSTLLGLKFPPRPTVLLTRNLKDDLNDFLALVPREKIVDLFYQYLEEDEDFGEALDYVMSDEFKSLLVEIESISEVKDLFEFLEASELDVYGFLNKIHEILGLEPNHQARSRSNRITGGLPGFIIDVKALLPIEQIKKLYYEKLETSHDFATLVTRLKSKEFQALVDKVYANPKLQDLIKRAEAKGVDVQAILDFLSTLLGLKFPPRPTYLKADDEEVIEILRYIWSQIDIDGIFDIVIDYMVEDEEFKKVIKFMLNDEFKKILVDIEDIKEVKELLKFFNDTGIDIYRYVNQLHELLGIAERLPLLKGNTKITGGIKGLFHDIWALLPIEELRAYYFEKRQTNKKFNDFVTRLEEHELQNAINALNDNKGFNLLLVKLEKLGVDLDKVIELIMSVLGVKFPERPPSPF